MIKIPANLFMKQIRGANFFLSSFPPLELLRFNETILCSFSAMGSFINLIVLEATLNRCRLIGGVSVKHCIALSAEPSVVNALI